MATRSPGENNPFATIVWWISASNSLKKHALQMRLPVFGLTSTAGERLHASHSLRAFFARGAPLILTTVIGGTHAAA